MQNPNLPEPFNLQAPPEFHGPEIDVNTDTMDKITGHYEVSCASKLKFPDAMDRVIRTDTETLCVETSTVEGELPVIKLQSSKRDKTLHVKKCHICITRLETILFDDSYSKTTKSHDNDLPAGEYFTRSCTRTKPERVSRRPRKVSKDVHYMETETSDDDKKQRRKALRPKSKPATEGPSITQIRSQKSRSMHPNRRLPPVSTNAGDTEDRDTDPPTTSSLPVPLRKPSAKLKGTKPKVHSVFETKVHTLKKSHNKKVLLSNVQDTCQQHQGALRPSHEQTWNGLLSSVPESL